MKQLHLDQQKIGSKKKNNLQQQVKKYLNREDVSIVTQKKPKKHPILVSIPTRTVSKIPGQGFIWALLIMSDLWKKIEFYKGESNHEAIVIAAGGLVGTLQTSPSRQVFLLWKPFLPTNFFPLPMKVSVHPIIKWGTHLYMSLFLFVCLSIHPSFHPSIYQTPYLRNRNHNFWYTCVKWPYLQKFFSFLWNFVIWVRSVNGQKMVQNDKKICLSHSISQEPYIIWLSFTVHMCKMIISPRVFFSFSKFWFFGLLGG